MAKGRCMNIYDTFAFVVCLLAVLTLALGIGCAPRDTSDVSYMPYVELDYRPARINPVRSNITSPDEIPAGDTKGSAHNNRPWRHIVIHHSATEYGNAAHFNKMHKKRGWDEMGYHFVIGNGNGAANGKVEIGSRWRKQKWGAHTGGTPNNEYNNFGIGICLVGNFMSHNPSKQQLSALRKLVEKLMVQYDIPAYRIISHQQAPNANTECCGRVFVNYLNGAFRQQFAQAAK